ncbi:hypothetical protein AXA44_31400 [Rhodococcus sp. SC4]|nr:hypothetical protein AXA44_31400 [Rhodococcus sp. SC4]KXX56439.1 hypothetical protein AZG88_14605 [Rhodococcus sp. LB1]
MMDLDCLAAGKGYGDVQFLSRARAEHRKDDSVVGSDTSGVCIDRRPHFELRHAFGSNSGQRHPSELWWFPPDGRIAGLMDVQPLQVRSPKRATESNAGIGYPEDDGCLR